MMEKICLTRFVVENILPTRCKIMVMKTNAQCLLDTIIEQDFTEQTLYKTRNEYFNFFCGQAGVEKLRFE